MNAFIERWQGILVWICIILLICLYRMRSGKYRMKKYAKTRQVYDGAARSLAVGIRMWYPVVYFLVADVYREEPKRAWRLDLGVSELLSGKLAWTTARMIGWGIVAALAILALISLLRGLKDFLPHCSNADLLAAHAIPFCFWVVLYTRLLFNIGNARFDPNETFRDSVNLLDIIPATARVVVPLIFIFLLYLFYHQLKDREKAVSGMTKWEYEELVREAEKEKARREEERNRARSSYGSSSSYRSGSTGSPVDEDDSDFQAEDRGRATMQNMPSVIRDSAGRTYRRTSSGGSPATYTCDEDYSTVAIYNVYQSESYWMNTSAGSFDIISW